MSVFDTKTATSLKVADPGTDRSLPASRSLQFAAMVSHEALQGTRGEHCQTIHGDQQQEFRGCLTERIRRDVLTTIAGRQQAEVWQSQSVRVSGNQKETLARSCTQTIIGPQIVLNGTVRNETRLGAYTEVYGKNEVYDDSNGKILTGDSHDEKYNVSYTAHALDIQLFGAQIGFVGANAQATQVSVAVRVVDSSFITAHGELTFLHMEEHGNHMEFHGAPKPTSIPPQPAPSHQPPEPAISHI